VAANAAWLGNMNRAVDYLSSQCVDSDVLDLRRDADEVHSLSDDILSHLRLLKSADTETQVGEMILCVMRLMRCRDHRSVKCSCVSCVS